MAAKSRPAAPDSESAAAASGHGGFTGTEKARSHIRVRPSRHRLGHGRRSESSTGPRGSLGVPCLPACVPASGLDPRPARRAGCAPADRRRRYGGGRRRRRAIQQRRGPDGPLAGVDGSGAGSQSAPVQTPPGPFHVRTDASVRGAVCGSAPSVAGRNGGLCLMGGLWMVCVMGCACCMLGAQQPAVHARCGVSIRCCGRQLGYWESV
jgi:hypothetical protein